MNYYRATFRKDRQNESPGWFTLAFVAKNYDMARSHARQCAFHEALAYCTVERLDRTKGFDEVEKIGGKFIDAGSNPFLAAKRVVRA